MLKTDQMRKGSEMHFGKGSMNNSLGYVIRILNAEKMNALAAVCHT
jgi:hypothetical protein